MAEYNIDAAWAELKETSVGYKNLKVRPPTDRNSRWYKAREAMGLNAPGGNPDAAAEWAELKETSVGYKNLRIKPPTDKNSRWYKAREIMGLNEPAPTPGAGAEWNKLFTVPSGLSVEDYNNQPRGRYYIDSRNGDRGNRHIKNLVIRNASPEAFKNGTPNVYLENFKFTDISGTNVQGINLQAGQTKFRAVYGLVDKIGSGDKFSHCCYVGPGWSDTAFGCVYFKSATGETFQYYDNPEGKHYLVHCTIGVSSGQEGLVSWDESPSSDDIMEVWNCIILDDIQHDSGNMKLRGLCCVTGDIPREIDTTGATIIREDPQLDSRGVPQNPKLKITDPAHKAWLPPKAWDGQPHSGFAGAA